MLDSRHSNSTAEEKDVSPKGSQYIVGTDDSASTIEGMHLSEGTQNTADSTSSTDSDESWSYIHVHYKTVDRIETDSKGFDDAPAKCFVHRTAITVAKRVNRSVRQRQVMRQTVSGLVFFQGKPASIQHYLKEHYQDLYLIKDPATGKPAVIPNREMVPFMEMVSYDPSLVRIMNHPISYYAQGRKLMRLLTGILRGHEGYIVRKAGDRKFIMPFGNKSISISNIHTEQFAEV